MIPYRLRKEMEAAAKSQRPAKPQPAQPGFLARIQSRDRTWVILAAALAFWFGLFIGSNV